MKIVVLDGHTLNPGDLSWAPLEALGNCEIYDRSRSDEVIERAGEAQIVLTNKTPLTADDIVHLPRLKYVGVLATGFNVVDAEAARHRGVLVSNVPAYGTTSVAQMTFAHILNLTQRVAQHAESVRHGRWHASEDFCFWNYPIVELDGLTLGIVGPGRIGQAVADIGKSFGMHVIVAGGRTNSAGRLPRVSMDHLFVESDVISLHCPLTHETKHLVDRKRLEQMKRTAMLINTSRGQLVDEEALAAALRDGRIAGAGIDVLNEEPPRNPTPLLSVPNCYITPHIAWATRAARQRLLVTAVANVKAYLDGHAQNIVNA